MIRRIFAAVGVVAACAVVVVLSGSGGQSSGRSIKIAFDNAFGVTQGGDLRVAGVKAGQTNGFDVSKGPECQGTNQNQNPKRTCAIVTADVTAPGFGSFRSDAHCDIRQQSLIGEYYVDCQPGNAKNDLPANAIIPDTRTTSTIPADLVQNVLRRPYRERLRLIIAELGTGVAGRAQDISELLHRAHPGLRQTDQVLKILADQDTTIQNFISSSNTVVAQLDQNKRDLARWVVEAGRTAQITATRQPALAAGFQKLPRFLDELRPTMLRLSQLTDQQTPLLQDLQRAAPSLTTFLTELGPFSQASQPAVRSLGQASTVGNVAFKNSSQDISVLRDLAAQAPGTGKPLRQLLQSLDNRKKAPEPDSRAAATAPPAPDPTAASTGNGFTGFESILNYVYFQTLGINEFDPISHVLRILGITDPQCSAYQADLRPASMGGKNPNADAIRNRCNSYLGPTQPGVTAPDVTSKGAYAAAANGVTAGKTNAKLGAVRGAGQPPAPATPGQVDPSKPHPTLAPSVQNLMNSLGQPSGGAAAQPSAGAAPQAPATPTAPGSGTTQQALDFLLSP